jgi:hypothetical protein
MLQLAGLPYGAADALLHPSFARITRRRALRRARVIRLSRILRASPPVGMGPPDGARAGASQLNQGHGETDVE